MHIFIHSWDTVLLTLALGGRHSDDEVGSSMVNGDEVPEVVLPTQPEKWL